MISWALFSIFSVASSPAMFNDIVCYKAVSQVSSFTLPYSPHQKLKIPPDITFQSGEVIDDSLILPDPQNKKQWFFFKDNTAQSFQFTPQDELFLISTNNKTAMGIHHSIKKSTNQFYKDSYQQEFENLVVYRKTDSNLSNKLKNSQKEPITITLPANIQKSAITTFYSELSRRLKGVQEHFRDMRKDDHNARLSDEAWRTEHLLALKKCEHIEDPEVQKEIQNQKTNLNAPAAPQNHNQSPDLGGTR